MPWGEKALAKAKTEDKLLLISIGYSACHWCHVMEHESFENEEIASIMNEHFVCIKVDREERPDIDHIYMNAVQLIAGNGGWPLNCFALPDGKPVYGGTYFRPDQWKDLLINISSAYKEDKNKFAEIANEIKDGIISLNHFAASDVNTNISLDEISQVITKISKSFDHENGGFVGSPKFPLPVNYFPLLRFSFYAKDNRIKNHVLFTLDKIKDGGIYDHLNGGFARYAVDKYWHVPHFEKMLYDNAQLITLYSEAYKINKSEDYKKVVYETVDFVERELRSPDGGFYSALDADSEGEEGKYYVWQKPEIDLLLGDKAELFCDYFDVSLTGNWESKNVLRRLKPDNEIAQKFNISLEKLNKEIDKAKEILKNHQSKRVKPGLDDKILTSWNALMITGLVNAYKAFGDERFLRLAIETTEFIEHNLMSCEFGLTRSYKKGGSKIDAFLDDYALFIQALIQLYQVTFSSKWLHMAVHLLNYTIQNFKNELGYFNYTSKNSNDLMTNTIEINDQVIPSSNSVMAHNLYLLGHYYLNESYISISKSMVLGLKDQLIRNPVYFANWIDLLILIIQKPYELSIMGSEAEANAQKINRLYLPNVFLSGGSKRNSLSVLENRFTNDKLKIYICRDHACLEPVQSMEEALQIILSD
jgi:uncharacterized protein YyaL (SSP411 family)